MGCSKYTDEYKSAVIEKGALDIVRHEKKRLYKSSFAWCECEDSQENGELVFMALNDDYDNFIAYCRAVPSLDCSLRLLESEKRKFCKVKDKIQDLVETGKAVFITLTFTDAILRKTSAQTRRRYVARYLKSQSGVYVANIDFSPKKQREHYHCVVDNRIDMSKWRYGFVYVEQVRTHDGNAQRVSKYVAKLSNHALKVKTLSTRLIYSRDTI